MPIYLVHAMDGGVNGFRKRFFRRADSTPAKQQAACSAPALLELPELFRDLIQAALSFGALRTRTDHHELVFGGPATEIVFTQQSRDTSGD